MYLSHVELEKMAETIFCTPEGDAHPFDLDTQTRVCSVDIRVSNVFWVMKKNRKVIDLSFSATFEISPTRLWEKRVIANNGFIDLKPGEMILGRTHELIKMPSDKVGKINTRSSYARIGLSTGCNCDLVNPGYIGHVPLELVNCTKNTIRIRAYLPLCQVFLMKLDGQVDADYASEKYQSKYNNDEGGPSVWWRDSLVKKVQKNITFSQVGEFSVDALRDKFEKIDDEGLQRFDQLLDKKSHNDSESFISEFTASESSKEWWYKARRNTSIWAFPALSIISVTHFGNSFHENTTTKEFLFSPSITAFILWSLLVLSIPPFIWYVARKERKYYGDI